MKKLSIFILILVLAVAGFAGQAQGEKAAPGEAVANETPFLEAGEEK